jgi:hypothetical protein
MVTINQSIDEKKWINFVKIKFHLNENIEWHCMQLEFNFNSISIEFKYIEWNINCFNSTKFNSNSIHIHWIKFDLFQFN